VLVCFAYACGRVWLCVCVLICLLVYLLCFALFVFRSLPTGVCLKCLHSRLPLAFESPKRWNDLVRGPWLMLRSLGLILGQASSSQAPGVLLTISEPPDGGMKVFDLTTLILWRRPDWTQNG
jgi:hypothetical protein